MIIHNFETENSILQQFVAEIRDQTIQKDSLRFRKNIERIGEILGYEMSKTLDFISQSVQTPLGNKEMKLPKMDVVLCSILRAGLPLHQGLLNYFDNAENAFISAYRDHSKDSDDNFEIVVNYLASPSIENKTLVLADPMLASGKTLENTYKALQNHGVPRRLHIISIIGSKLGVDYIKNTFPDSTHLWIAAIDDDLSPRSYIIPGLGDAGDLAFGTKL